MAITINLDKKGLFKVIDGMSDDEKLELFNKLEHETIIARARKIKQSIPKHNLTPDDVLEAVKIIYESKRKNKLLD